MQNDMFLITPMTKTISLEAGEVYHGYVTIANPSDSSSEFNYRASISPYGVAGEDYEADLATKSNHTMIADWIMLEEAEGTLQPNETRHIDYTITVPEDAPAGAQYAAIVVSQNNETESASGFKVDDVFEMASIIYADVAGETVHEGEIIENTIPGFVTDGELMVGARLSNSGNVHDEASIVISVKNNLTGEVILPVEGYTGQYSELVMPDTTRYVTRKVDNLPLLGLVHIEQKIYYNGKVSEASQDVIICPIWLMVVALLVVVGLGAIIARMVRRHRRAKIVQGRG